jgi:SAM-dependent methyltransferase
MAEERAVPDTAEWPPESLETLAACPLCGSGERTVLYQGLEDRVFFCAPGRWTLYSCRACGGAFLDPRPDAWSIHRAYHAYYTHEAAVAEDPASQGLYWRWLRALRNDHLNAYYGYRLEPALPGGRRLLTPSRRVGAGLSIRHLSLPVPSPRLLDLGCGNGVFLLRMQQTGWKVEGLEPDPQAAAAARQAGLTVQQSVLAADTYLEDSFDAITLNHVIEHLHQPRETLEICYRILRPGGVLWIATPNLQSLGHTQFGAVWVGLDPPRHLVLFTPSSLTRALHQAGFRDVSPPIAGWAARWYFKASESIAAGKDPMRSSLRGIRRWKASCQARYANMRAWLNPALGEEVILLAQKGSRFGG